MFAAATVRAYAFDVWCFARFCVERELGLADVVPADLFDWIAWQGEGARPRTGKVVALAPHAGAAPATSNRRVAAVRALCECQVMRGARGENPVPAPRRGRGLRAKARGTLGHLGPGQPRGGGWLVRQAKRLPEALDPADFAVFLADLRSHRGRAIVVAMLPGGLRAGSVRRLRLADVDQGLRRLRVLGKGNRERVVPVDRGFFVELAAYLRLERPVGPATPECFVVLHGATAGAPLSEAGQHLAPSPRIFRRDQGAPAPVASHLRHRAGRRQHRPPRAAGADGHAHTPVRKPPPAPCPRRSSIWPPGTPRRGR